MSPSIESIVATGRGGVTFTAFQAAHGHAMSFTEQAADSLHHVNLTRTFQYYEEAGPGWTLWAGETIVGCAGIMIPWPGLGHAWLLPSPLLGRYPITTVQTVVTTLRDLIASYNLRRVECEVQVGFVIGERFVRALGFVPEGPPKLRWGPNDEDYQPYVILQPRGAP